MLNCKKINKINWDPGPIILNHNRHFLTINNNNNKIIIIRKGKKINLLSPLSFICTA